MLSRPQDKSRTRPDASLRRAVFVAALIVFWMLAICARLVYLQVSKHDELVQRAQKQQQGAIETGAERGQLCDREGRQLARSVDTDSIFVAPDEIDDVDGTAEQLAAALGLDSAHLIKQLDEAKTNNLRFIWIARRVTPEQSEKLLALKLAGVHSRKEPKRFYPNGTLAAHVLGFVGLDNAGHAGIEQFYNQKISGEPPQILVLTLKKRNQI